MFHDDSADMTEYRHEIWRWIVASIKDFSASTMDGEGFSMLSTEQQADLASKYMSEFGVDGDAIVSAQGMSLVLWLGFAGSLISFFHRSSARQF